MINIKINTEYSLLQSLIKIPSLIAFLKTNNINVCGICDNELFGSMEFYLACHKEGIKPIIGLDVTINEYHYYLYPKNYAGYQNLLKINTKKYNGLEINDIEDENIFIVIPFSSYDTYGEIKNKDNLYIGYNTPREKASALLITNNVLYIDNVRCLNRDDVLYLKYLQDLGGVFEYNDNVYFKTHLPNDDLKFLETFVNKIDLIIPEKGRYIPKYKEGINSFDYLKTLTLKGLEKRLNGTVSPKYLTRLNEELKVINEMGFVDYFLIVYDYVLYAKKNDIIVGPGRGSAAGSLVSYAIGITDIDPVKYDLLFARFLNPARKKMPDIDIDFEDTKRSLVIDYVRNKYGQTKVATGLTFNTMKAKLILRDLAKVLKIDNNLFDKFIKTIDSHKSLKENMQSDVVKKYLSLYKELKNLYDIAMHLENLKKNTSTHASGIVICSEDLDNLIPIYLIDGKTQTGIEMAYLENMGLLKMDFLGLKNLSMLRNIVSNIPNLNLNEIPFDDEKTFEIFKNADTDDIFQFESRYAKDILKDLQVKSFDELVIATALVRPGPASQIPEYIKNKNNPNFKVEEPLHDILSSTYGIIIFQEQVMKIFEHIGGYTPYEADSVRIAISKKHEEIIKAEEEKFIAGALKKGYTKEFAIDLFNKMKKFAEYGFNKSHAVSYAEIIYKLAFLKANYPVEFTLSLLIEGRDMQTKKRLLTYLKMHDVEILKPNINVSLNEFVYKNGKLLLPFNMIKGFNESLYQKIITGRTKNFTSIYDFVLKCPNLTEKEYEILVKSGTLDAFKLPKKTLINARDILFNYASLGLEDASKPVLPNEEEYSDDILRDFENDYYGFYVGNHPCSIYKDVVKLKDTEKYLFKNINMVLLVEKITKITTKKNEEMAFVLASDETGSKDLTLFPEVFKTVPNLKNNDIILVSVKSSKRFDKYELIVNNIKRKQA